VVMLVMVLATGIASVYANTGEGTIGDPILGTTGAPALAAGAPPFFSGAISVLYADGTPVVLETNRLALDLCGSFNYNNTRTTTTTVILTTSTTWSNSSSSCTTVSATLNQTAPGVYTYSFTPPSWLTGTITIYVKAYALADDNGRIFPQVDTSIGAYAYTRAPTTGSSVPSNSSLPAAGTPPLTSQAVNAQPVKAQSIPAQPTAATQPVTGASPIVPLLITLSVLAVAGSLLTVSKRP